MRDLKSPFIYSYSPTTNEASTTLKAGKSRPESYAFMDYRPI